MKVNKMRRQTFNLFVSVLVISFVFAACEKKKSSDILFVIEAKDVINSCSDIDSVKAIVEDENEFFYYEVASAKYQDKGFKLVLPAVVPDKYLQSASYGLPASIRPSVDKNAKVGFIEGQIAFDNTGKEIGRFQFRNEDNTFYTRYLYADRGFTIIGIDDFDGLIMEYECYFKKGWNILYFVEMENRGIARTQKPDYAGFRWYYYDRR